MLTRTDCIKAAEALSHGNTIDRRNAARSLADYCRVILKEIASHYPGYGIVKLISIKHRNLLLQAAVPELFPFQKLFNDIHLMRDHVDHNDEEDPSSDELDNLIQDVKNLDKVFNEKIYLKLNMIDTSPYAKLLEDWNEVLYMYDNLDNYVFSDRKGFEDVVTRVGYYLSLSSGFTQLDKETINRTRLELHDLQTDLRKLYEQQRKGRKASNFEE